MTLSTWPHAQPPSNVQSPSGPSPQQTTRRSSSSPQLWNAPAAIVVFTGTGGVGSPPTSGAIDVGQAKLAQVMPASIEIHLRDDDRCIGPPVRAHRDALQRSRTHVSERQATAIPLVLAPVMMQGHRRRGGRPSWQARARPGTRSLPPARTGSARRVRGRRRRRGRLRAVDINPCNASRTRLVHNGATIPRMVTRGLPQPPRRKSALPTSTQLWRKIE